MASGGEGRPQTSPELVRLIMELRGQGVTDPRVLDAIETTPRVHFVPPALAASAYENRPLPIGEGQTISQPFIVGLMTQALRLEPRQRVLEIGTGSGFQTAILARLTGRVYTVERFASFQKEAEQRFRALRFSNIVTRHGDGAEGWPEQAPFERIIATAAAPEIPQTLVAQLKPGGIMVCPVGPPDSSQVLLRLTKHDAGVEVENLGFVAFVPLVAGRARS